MKAVAYQCSMPIDHPDALQDVELPKPVPAGRDLLVAVRAVSVNPVDYKVRLRVAPPEGEWKVLGWDAAGVVEAAGPDCTLFKAGDEVFYAGALQRQGTNAEFHLVDERIVGSKPKTVGFAEAAALPLTSITAWEMLFERLQAVRDGSGDRSLLIVGGAGGVGSILIQLARGLTRMTVIATASRPETQAWCRELGAHHVIDHAQPMEPQLAALGVTQVTDIAALTATDRHFPALVAMLAPQGRIAAIDDPEAIDVRLLKSKSASFHWELMFTRSMFETPDMIEQHRLLDEVARLVDAGVLRSTLAETLGRIDAATIREGHRRLETGHAQGKLVLQGF